MKLSEWQFIGLKKAKRKSILLSISTTIVVSFLLIAMFNSLISNNKPIACKCNGVWEFPAFYDFFNDLGLNRQEFKHTSADEYGNCSHIIHPPVRYHFSVFGSLDEKLLPPGSLVNSSIGGKHLLGTDRYGRDVAAMLVRGTYISLKIGLLSTLFSFVLGAFIGLHSGYYGDSKIKLSLLEILILLTFIVFSLYVLIYTLPFGYFLGILIVFLILFKLIQCLSDLYHYRGDAVNRSNLLALTAALFFKRFSIPIDMLTQKVIEIRKSIPTLILLLACLPLFKKASHTNLIILITIFGWHGFTRFMRAETLRLREIGFVKSVYALGLSDARIIWRHIVPNAIPVLWPVVIFSLGANMILESSLSFLGVGLPFGEVSWGTLIDEGRGNPNAWWLVVFPGFLIFLILVSVNLMVKMGFIKSKLV